MPKKIQFVTKEVLLEGFKVVGGQVLAEIPIPAGHEGRAEDLFRIIDRMDADSGATDGDIDIEAAIRAKVPRKLQFIKVVTGETIDLDLDLEVRIV